MKDIEKLVIEELSWKPTNRHIPVLNQITAGFEEGEFIGILGPNGSGKTSLIRHLMGFLQTKKGNISLNKRPIQAYSRRTLATELAFVPQNTAIDVEFTVYDVVAMGRLPYQKRFSGLSKLDKEKIEEALELTNCQKLRDELFSTLSGGEAQRVCIARAIVQDTPWIILDEPIAHLDISHQVELMETLKELNQKKKTIIAILHDLNLAATYCQKILLMKQGEVYAFGEVNEVMTEENLREVYEIGFDVFRNDEKNKIYFMPIVE